jgi:hypothetical protein
LRERINTCWLPLHNLLTSHQASGQGFTTASGVAADLQAPPDDEPMEDVILGDVADVAFCDEEMVQLVMLKYLIMQWEKIRNLVAFTHGTKEKARKMLGDSA